MYFIKENKHHQSRRNSHKELHHRENDTIYEFVYMLVQKES